VVAAGTQLYVFENSLKELDITEQFPFNFQRQSLHTIFDVSRRLNGPLPVYHPQFLQQAILAGLDFY
jgi:hypothetical protein